MPAFVFTAAEQESSPAETQPSLFALTPSRSLTEEQISFMVARLRDDAQTCWEALVQASALARQRARLLEKLESDELRSHPSRPAALHRAIALELDLRQRLCAAAHLNRWADTTWHALTPAQRSGPAAEAWDVPPERESLTAVVWTVWPPFGWPAGFAWEAEVGHLGSADVALWLGATGKSPPNPPRLGPALQLAIDEGMTL